MKKILFSLLMLLFSIFVCQAQVKLEVNGSGEYRAKSTPDYVESGISADSAAMEYIDYFPQAVSNPMSIVPVGETEKIKKMTTLFKALKEIKKSGIIYDLSTNEIVLSETRALEEETSFSLIFGLISISFMILFEIFNKKKNDYPEEGTYYVLNGSGEPIYITKKDLAWYSFFSAVAPFLSLCLATFVSSIDVFSCLAICVARGSLLFVFAFIVVTGALSETGRRLIYCYYVAMVAYFVFTLLWI